MAWGSDRPRQGGRQVTLIEVIAVCLLWGCVIGFWVKALGPDAPWNWFRQ